MRIKLTKIGNSQGVRLPKALLTDCGFTNEADLEVRHKMIILSPVKEPRSGWLNEMGAELEQKPLMRGGEWQW
ncbi:MAG: hypothetical protein IKV03_04530 [Alphaproteobacteria bacterium]|nr:hypothetical protein [Alphaproteobacteria bacterium]